MRQVRYLTVIMIAAMAWGCGGGVDIGFLTGTDFIVKRATVTRLSAFNFAIGGGLTVGGMDIRVTTDGPDGECVLNFQDADFIGAQIGPIFSLGMISMIGDFDMAEVVGGIPTVDNLRGTYIGAEGALTPVVGGNYLSLSNGHFAMDSEWVFTVGLEAGVSWDWIDVLFYVASCDGQSNVPTARALSCLGFEEIRPERCEDFE